MATEYTVALKNGVSGPARQAKGDAIALQKKLEEIENRKQQVAGLRAFRQADKERRTLAFRNLQRQQREEERFTRYRIGLQQKEYRESVRIAARQERDRARAAAQRASTRRSNYQGQVGANAGVVGSAVRYAGAAAVAGGTLALGYVASQAVDTVKLLEGAKMTLGALYKDQAKADRTVTDIYKFAKLTKFESPELITSITRIASVVDDDYQQKALLGAMSDAATLYRLNGEDLNRAFLNIQQSFSTGHVETRDLKEFIHALPGLKGDELKGALGEILGIQGKDQQDTIQKVTEAVSKGKVGPKAFVSAFEKVILKATGENKLGAYAEKMGNTLEGLISNIKSGLGDLLGLAEADKWPALVSLKNNLKDVADLFDPSNDKGQAFTKVLQDLSGTIAPISNLIRQMASLGHYFETSGVTSERFAKGLTAIGGTVVIIAGAIGAMGVAVVSAFGALGDLLEGVAIWASTVGVRARDAAGEFVMGFVNGIIGGHKLIFDAVAGLGKTALTALKTTLKIQSPSKVAMQMGAYTTEGFARGIERGNGRVASASREMAGSAMGGMGASSGRGAGAVLNLSITNNIRANSGDDLEALAEKTSMMTAATVRRELERCFGMSLQMGTT